MYRNGAYTFPRFVTGAIANERHNAIPVAFFALSFIGLRASAWIGSLLRKRQREPAEDLREDFGVILAATLTLLALIIGFSFSMAITRYDQRKNLEEEEANAIGTEYLRADLFSSTDAAKVRALLVNYLSQRVLFYTTRDEGELQQIGARTTQLQTELWSVVRAPTGAQPPAIVVLAVSGMNDVLNSQGYTQAAWWNEIPIAAWALMALIAICGNFLVGYGLRSTKAGAVLFPVLPFVLSIAFMLIADIDAPRHGFIRVHPQNLISLSESLRAR